MEGAMGRVPLPQQVWRADRAVAVIGARKWEALMADLAGATVLMQADIRYFQPSEISHAWHWVHTAKFADEVPVRMLVPPGHLMSGYAPEYVDI